MHNLSVTGFISSGREVRVVWNISDDHLFMIDQYIIILSVTSCQKKDVSICGFNSTFPKKLERKLSKGETEFVQACDSCLCPDFVPGLSQDYLRFVSRVS